MIEKFSFTNFTSSTIPTWENRFHESFGREGPGWDLYNDSIEFKDLMDIKIFGEKKPDITSGFELVEDSYTKHLDEDVVNLAFTETIFELQMQEETLKLMNEWL